LPTERSVLDEVIEFYLNSGDFNGFYVSEGRLSKPDIKEVARLVRAGLLQVVGDSDFLNPHIRPWPSKRTLDDQLADVAALEGGRTFCLYPTAKAMEGRQELSRFDKEPYKHRLAAGAGTLEVAYFSVDVIEQYRNDPRYHYWFGDVEVHFGITDEAYSDPGEAERDKIASLRVGFAYDHATIRAGQVRRYACAFLGDLADLTPEHQQRWRTYEVMPSDDTGPHPVWWAMQMGHWPDGVGPFERILVEMDAINYLFRLAYGTEVFRSTERPREWGWVLRPSTTEWQQFILTTDKLLSENLNKNGLDAVNARVVNDDGSEAGTLTRLGSFLEDSTPCPPPLVDRIVRPLKQVRRERQKPAHELTVAKTDATITAQQRDVLGEIGGALHLLRQVLQHHPAARGWVAPEHLDEHGYVV
jgi:hypothetical protein